MRNKVLFNNILLLCLMTLSFFIGTQFAPRLNPNCNQQQSSISKNDLSQENISTQDVALAEELEKEKVEGKNDLELGLENTQEQFKSRIFSPITTNPKATQSKLAPVWAETPQFWDLCVEDVKQILKDDGIAPEPLTYPNGEEIKPVITVMIGSEAGYQGEFKTLLRALESNFQNIHHIPIVAFHFNLPEDFMKNVRLLSPSTNITFIKITKPRPEDTASDVNPTPIGHELYIGHSSSLEYRYQSYVFMETVFRHPAVQEYNWVIRMDCDVSFPAAINYNIASFMSHNGFVFSNHHWSHDPPSLCTTLYPSIERYRNAMPNWVASDPSRQLPSRCLVKGGAFFVAYAPFFRSARWEAAWRYVKCVGGIWTHRQAEQNWFPTLIALLTDDPEKRMHTFSDIILAHKGAVLQPHQTWGVPQWPTLDNSVTLPDKQPNDKKGCVVYFATQEDIVSLKRSLVNLQMNYLQNRNAPVFIFHTGFNEAEIKNVQRAVSSQIKINFVSVDTKSPKIFFVEEMAQHAALESFGYFMMLDPRTNFVAAEHTDLLDFMRRNSMILAYHRSQAQEGLPRALPSGKSDSYVIELVGKWGGEFKNRKLPPKSFTYPFNYFALGDLDFLRTREYREFVANCPEKDPDITWPLAVGLLKEHPWKVIGDVSYIMLNYNSQSNAPLSQRSWWGAQEMYPPWPHKYRNYDPPSDSA